MPIYKNRIGTAYEGHEDYEKTEKCYRDALSFLEELNFQVTGTRRFSKEMLLMHSCFKRNIKMRLKLQKGLIIKG